MFNSINFLFLLSLGITSWILLCFFNHLENAHIKQIEREFNMDFDLDNIIFQRSNYDIYFNFICIFACIYALAKVTSVTEQYIARRVHETLNGIANHLVDDDFLRTIDDLRTQRESLEMKVSFLKEQNSQLELTIQELQERKLTAKSGNNSNSRLFEFNCSKMFKELDAKKPHIPEPKQPIADALTNWEKYLKIHKYAIAQPRSKTLEETTVENSQPLFVISTEELQNMTTHGKFPTIDEELLRSLAFHTK